MQSTRCFRNCHRRHRKRVESQIPHRKSHTHIIKRMFVWTCVWCILPMRLSVWAHFTHQSWHTTKCLSEKKTIRNIIWYIWRATVRSSELGVNGIYVDLNLRARHAMAKRRQHNRFIRKPNNIRNQHILYDRRPLFIPYISIHPKQNKKKQPI